MVCKGLGTRSHPLINPSCDASNHALAAGHTGVEPFSVKHLAPLVIVLAYF